MFEKIIVGLSVAIITAFVTAVIMYFFGKLRRTDNMDRDYVLRRDCEECKRQRGNYENIIRAELTTFRSEFKAELADMRKTIMDFLATLVQKDV